MAAEDECNRACKTCDFEKFCKIANERFTEGKE